jgi:hypothetical protein
VILRVQDDGKFLVNYSEYGNSEIVDIGALKYLGPLTTGSPSHSPARDARAAGSRRSGRSRSPRGGGSRRSSRSRSPRRESRSEELSEAELERMVKERNKKAAEAVGRDYAKRPSSTKSALMLPAMVGTARKRSKSPPREVSRAGAASSRRDDRYLCAFVLQVIACWNGSSQVLIAYCVGLILFIAVLLVALNHPWSIFKK